MRQSDGGVVVRVCASYDSADGHFLAAFDGDNSAQRYMVILWAEV